MWSKSNSLSLAYVTVAAVLVGSYCIGLMSRFVGSIGLPADLADVFTALMLAVLAIVALVMGAETAVVAVVGTIGSFLVLTLIQEALIRYLTLGAILFCIGMYGMVTSRNAVRVLMSIELMLNAANINLVAFARFIDPITLKGQIFAIFVLTVAAAEAAVGLAIVLAVYRNMSTVNMEKFNSLKW